MKRGYRIGITVHVRPDGDLGLFDAGIKQNVLFLAMLFHAAPNCAAVYLLNDTGVEPILPPWLPFRPKFLASNDPLVAELDYVLGVGTVVTPELAAAVHAKGGKVIRYNGGNDAVLSMEAVIGRPEPMPGGPTYYDVGTFDAVWMTPQHVKTNLDWARLLYRCPVETVPQVWSPILLEATRPDHPDFGYKPGRKAWRIGILEPNNTVMKTSHWPMLVCEEAYRRKPEAIETVLVSNTLHLKEFKGFQTFANGLDLVRDKKMTFEARHATPFFLQHCDAVVAHQWENELNYLYYDVLWGGYPLIHNSKALRNYGYHFSDFETSDGAHELLYALQTHDDRLKAEAAANARLFQSLSPTNLELIETHEDLLEELE
jgi:Protein of unknown function (DUF2827)